MHRDNGFAALVIVFVLVLFAMSLAQCDVRNATRAPLASPTQSGGTL